MLPSLTGRKVLIVGNAPGISREVVSQILTDYTIAVSAGVKHAPFADMLVGIDAKIQATADVDTVAAFNAFAGLFLVGVPSDDLRTTLHHMPYERVRFAPGNEVDIRNNGISAIRVAAELGATDITLVGFSAEEYDAREAHCGFAGVTAIALPALIAELAEKYVSVKYYVAPVITAKKK